MTLRAAASKRSVLLELLREGMVLVALDARHRQVVVPDHLRSDPQLRLNLSQRFGLPLVIDRWGVHATLTFGGAHFACQLPWAAMFLLVSHVDGHPYLFVEDIPHELLLPQPEPVADEPGATDGWGPGVGRPAAGDRRLALVEPPSAEPRLPAGRRASAHPTTRLGLRHLRLVK